LSAGLALGAVTSGGDWERDWQGYGDPTRHAESVASRRAAANLSLDWLLLV
jgi:tRNA(Arg) A34 adenosine deaminase TadA